ncbi:hypothetical protein F2Q69_00002336 [Brassica cretica]|uniref:Uncharacterized protein n=1 Tax=Brassica cretica TaxID=69181 RepID=A0A8S9PA63_BRACR|nr:hypothetical protein F2Q69_00002336 [Brassica cretica]
MVSMTEDAFYLTKSQSFVNGQETKIQDAISEESVVEKLCGDRKGVNCGMKDTCVNTSLVNIPEA